MEEQVTDTFAYGIDRLSPGLALELARGQRKGSLKGEALDRVRACCREVRSIVDKGNVVYGVNTGFGPLCDTRISVEETRILQYNILKSHSVGMGDPIPEEIALLMMVLKVHALAQGYSGAAPETLERILWHIENQVVPVVPSQGSVGASGDLAPLSHLFLPLIGLGKVTSRGRLLSGREMLKEAGLEPLKLGPKEGLALINGTQFIAAWGVASLSKMKNCLDTADLVGAMSLEALLGSAKPFMKELHDLRPYQGTRLVAHRLMILLKESEILESHKDCGRVQDPYSLRCMPPVHGASRNAWLHLKETLMVELNAVTDNPVIFNADHTISGGNFHGEPMALPLDYSTVAASELGNISDRRTYLLLDSETRDLPRLLMKNTGINSGFMIPQYTSAALASENKSLCFPPSADSIPTSLGQEDHVSMGSISGRRLFQVLGNVEKILAVELMCAAQAFDFRKPLKSGPILEACHDLVREKIDHADADRFFAEDLETARQIITSGSLVRTANETAREGNMNLNGEKDELFGLY